MKKTTKNPITFFREANEKRQAAVKNSLKKAQNGIIAGPKTEAQTRNTPSDDPMAYGRGPRRTSPKQEMFQKIHDTITNERSNAMLDQMLNSAKSERMKELMNNYKIDAATGKMNETSPGTGEIYKKGGSAKPSAGLSKKTKSNIAKKASAGKDIGKKGKGFAKVAAAAGGGEKGKRIAAAAMWKNIKRG